MKISKPFVLEEREQLAHRPVGHLAVRDAERRMVSPCRRTRSPASSNSSVVIPSNASLTPLTTLGDVVEERPEPLAVALDHRLVRLALRPASGSAAAIAFHFRRMKSACTYSGFSHQRVPSLSNVAMRSSGGRSGVSGGGRRSRRTRGSAAFAAPSFQLGSGRPAAHDVLPLVVPAVALRRRCRLTRACPRRGTARAAPPRRPSSGTGRRRRGAEQDRDDAGRYRPTGRPAGTTSSRRR